MAYELYSSFHQDCQELLRERGLITFGELVHLNWLVDFVSSVLGDFSRKEISVCGEVVRSPQLSIARSYLTDELISIIKKVCKLHKNQIALYTEHNMFSCHLEYSGDFPSKHEL